MSFLVATPRRRVLVALVVGGAALLGQARTGATTQALPERLAYLDAKLMAEVASAIGDEGRAKHREFRTLRGFERVSLKGGETRPVSFRLSPAKDFTHYDEGKKAYAVEPGDFEIELGASSQDIRLTGRVRVDP